MSNKRHKIATPNIQFTSLLSYPKAHRLTTKKGTANRRVIAVAKDDDYEYYLHATKGYRRRIK